MPGAAIQAFSFTETVKAAYSVLKKKKVIDNLLVIEASHRLVH